jgi:hypothetical protein
MAYKYAGKDFVERREYTPFSDDEARAKFTYFREAESKINGGPAPLPRPVGCGTNSGYMKHFKLKEERCAPCKAAHTQVELKRQRAQALAQKIGANGNRISSTSRIKNGPGSAANTSPGPD